jgi:cellulose biosynthesis protein BcsQ
VRGKIVSVVNRKGGVGKTTVALALADTIADTEQTSDDKKIIVAVDLDPQASLSHALLLKPKTPPEHAPLTHPAVGKTLACALRSRIRDAGKAVAEYLTVGVGPIGLSYALLANEAATWDEERRELRKHGGEQRLQKCLVGILDDLAKSYQYVLIDCPPGQTVLAEAAIRHSDLVLCPTTADWLSFWGLSSFDDYLHELLEGSTRKPPARFVLTKFKPRPARTDPQDKITQLISDFKAPNNYITLLLEVGENSEIGAGPIKLPYDTRVSERLLGAPNPRRLWPWETIYTSATKIALRRLLSAINKELNNGRSIGAPPGNGTLDQTEWHTARGNPQNARQSRGRVDSNPSAGSRPSAPFR